jgi:hypothetical protein
MRGWARRLRSNFSIGSSRVAIHSQLAWYWRWLLIVLMMAAVATIVWWAVENSYRITGSSLGEVRKRIAALDEENATLKAGLETARSTLVERDRQLQIEKAAQGELGRTVAQLQEENASLKEDLGFLRRLMSSGATPEGVSLSDLKIERDGKPNEFRYRALLTQGGQRKQDFKGRVQVIAHFAQGGTTRSLTFPEGAGSSALPVDFRFYYKIDGRFAIPEDAVLKSVEMRILALPGGQVKLSRTVNLP